jgi:hypothetical protein
MVTFMSDESPSENSDQQTDIRPRMVYKLICASKVKKHALEFAKANRAQKFTRVGEEFLISCEAALRTFIQGRVKAQPSKGKTLK